VVGAVLFFFYVIDKEEICGMALLKNLAAWSRTLRYAYRPVCAPYVQLPGADPYTLGEEQS
jgi:hypothetical protein